MARKGRRTWEGRTPPKHRKQRQPSRPRSWTRQKEWFRAVDAFRRRQRQARGAPGRGGIRGRRQARTVHIVCDLPSCSRTFEGHRRGGPYRTRGRYCSISCKQKAYRDRQRARIAPPPLRLAGVRPGVHAQAPGCSLLRRDLPDGSPS